MNAIPAPPSSQSPAAHAYCRGCGYALVGLLRGACPECGRAFDPADARTFLRRPPRLGLRRWVPRAIAVVLLVSAALAVLLYSAHEIWRAEQAALSAVRPVARTLVVRRGDETFPGRLLPGRWAQTFDRVEEVHLAGCNGGEFRRADLGAFRSLRVVRAIYCSVSDDDLAAVAGLPELVELTLTDNEITGPGLSHVAACPRLRRLSLAANRALDDDALRPLARLTSLRALDLRGTDVGDDGLAHLACLTALEELHLSGTRVTDAGVQRIARLSALRELSLAHTAVTDDAIAHLATLAALERLDLSRTEVSDVGLARLKPLRNLKWVGLGGTFISDLAKSDLRASVPGVTFDAK